MGYNGGGGGKVRTVAQPNIIKNANGDFIQIVERTTTNGEPNGITQRNGPKGGIDRNYYGADGKQIKQISNNDHDNPKNHNFGKNGEHAHDYTWTADGVMTRSRDRELTEQERKENADIL